MSLEKELCGEYAACLTGMFLLIGNRDAVQFPTENHDQVEVDGRKLYLPTDTNLESRDLENAAFFHPLCEDALHGQSKMIHFLTRRMLAACSLRLDMLVQGMMDLTRNPAKQKSIKSAEAIKYLTIIKDIKEDAPKKWSKLVTEMSENDGLFSIYLNRNKEIDGTHYARLCVIDLPIIRDTQPGATLCGVNVHSKANKEMFRSLVTQIFKDMPMEFGSNHTTPYFHALMSAYYTVTMRLNNVIKLFKGAIDLPIINMEWFDRLFTEKFDTYYRIIPHLELNTGEDVRSVRDAEEERAGTKRVDNLPNSTRVGKGVSLADFDKHDRSERSRDRDRNRRDFRDDRRDSDYEAFQREINGRSNDRDDRDNRRDRRDDRRDSRWDDRSSRRDRMRGGFSSDRRDDYRDDRYDRDRDRRDDRRDNRRSGSGVNLFDYD